MSSSATSPPPVRDAATIMVVRDAPGAPGIEVCMIRRNLEAEFVAGAYVFPGGSVDPGDAAPGLVERVVGRDGAAAAATVRMSGDGRPMYVAAVRECFEEANLLLARTRSGGAVRPLDVSDPGVRARLAEHRRALNDGTATFAEVAEAEDLVFPADELHFVSHWITPRVAPKRFDTRFFVTGALAGQRIEPDSGETIDAVWVAPADALAAAEAGEVEMMPPTIANLRALAKHPTLAAVLAWAGRVEPEEIVRILPVVRFEGDRMIVLRPGDDGYEAALAEDEANAPEVLTGSFPPKPA